MFTFYFLGVGLPGCSIFCQFWLCEEAQCVYLRRHLDFVNFLSKLFIFLVLSCMSSLHILEIKHLSEVSLANMFSHNAGSPFIF